MPVSLQQLMANNTPHPWTQAGGSLASALLGSTQQSRQGGYERGLRMASLLENARRKRDQNLGFAGINPQALEAAGINADRAGLVSAMLHAGRDPRQVSGYQKDQQAIGWGDQAWQEATSGNPDLNLINLMNTVRAGKHVDLTKIQDHTALNPMVTPDRQSLAPTQIGLAEIMAKRAQAGAQNAMANERNAHASLYRTQDAAGGWNPNTGRRSGPYWPSDSTLKAMMTTPPTAEELKVDPFARPTLDVEGLQQALSWHATHPEASYSDWMEHQRQQQIMRADSAPRVGVSSPEVLGVEDAMPHGKVVRTGTLNGRKVVQYEDGTTEYAD